GLWVHCAIHEPGGPSLRRALISFLSSGETRARRSLAPPFLIALRALNRKGASHEPWDRQVVANQDRLGIRSATETTQPPPHWRGGLFGLRVKGRSNAPGAQTEESKASQRENPHGLHQTIYMQRTRANLSNG